MNLPFSIRFKDGRPTFFISKIWESLALQTSFGSAEYRHYRDAYKARFGENWHGFNRSTNPKHHTIREDKHNRWRPGMKIHMVVFNRTKNRFQFVPVLQCKAVQDVNIVYADHRIEVFIDCRHYDGISMRDDTEHEKLLTLARNDGFDSTESFFRFFNKDFAGKIIHWTDLRY